MTQGRYAGRGRADGRGGRDGRGGAGKSGRGSGYSTPTKAIKSGLCKELEANVFEYGGHGAADKMRITMEKIQQFVGIKYGEDIANELKNRSRVVIPQPAYSLATLARHVEYELLVRSKQSTLLTALRAQLATLQATLAAGGGGVPAPNDDTLLVIARLVNEIADLTFESQQPVPPKLTSEEAALYYNDGKTYSSRVATLDKHRGQAFALIIGQCMQLLLDKMKQEKVWDVVSASYDPLELYKLIESVVLKQTEDQYPVAATWDQYKQVYNAQQGTLTNTDWYRMFCMKVEVAESVGCVFSNDKTRDYCAHLEFKMAYAALGSDADRAKVGAQARERFIGFGLLRTANKDHDHLKNALSDDYTKGSDNYPINPQQTLLLLDKYSKKPTVVATSEGTAFAQKGKKGDAQKKSGNDDAKFEFDKEFYKDKECFRCGKKGHPKAACTVKLTASDDDKSVKSSSSNKSSSSDVSTMVKAMNKTVKQLGRALSQVTEELSLSDDSSIGAQSHAQVGRVLSSGHAFACRSTSIKKAVLLDTCSSDHIFCDPSLVSDIRKGDRQLSLESNGGCLILPNIATYEGFDTPVWFSNKAITNILSLLVVKREYKVSYDGDDFIIHRASKGYYDMVFKPHESGMHVLDINDPRSQASYAFVETVAENMQMFTKREIVGGNLARDLQAALAYPSNSDLKWITQANWLKDNPVGP